MPINSSAGRAYGMPGGSPRAESANYTTSGGDGRAILARILAAAGGGAQPPPIPQGLLNPAQPPPIPPELLNPAAAQQPPPIPPELLQPPLARAAGTPTAGYNPSPPPPTPAAGTPTAGYQPPPPAIHDPVLPDLSRNPYELERGTRRPVITPGKASGKSPLGADKSPLRKKKNQYRLRIEPGD